MAGGGEGGWGGDGAHRWWRSRVAIEAWRAVTWLWRGSRPKPPMEGLPVSSGAYEGGIPAGHGACGCTARRSGVRRVARVEGGGRPENSA